MPDDARTVAFDERAPADERNAARMELEKSHRALSSELIPAAGIQPIIDHIQNEHAFASMMKAEPIGRVQEHGARPNRRGMDSVYLDNLQIQVSGDYYEKGDSIGFEGLRQMVAGMPILNAVIMTRQRQVQRFCQMSEDGGPGFEIRHLDRDHKMDAGEKNAAKLLAKFMANCGWEWNPRARKRLRRESFTQFMTKSVRDTLTFDACPIETEMKRDRKLGIDGFYALDGSTIRLCTETGYNGNDEIYALQVIQGRIETAYTHDDLIYEVRNPRTDVRLAGYGMSETELLIRVVTGLLNAMQHNASGFDQNSIPKGILQLTGDYGADDLAAFKRYWQAAVRGTANAWNMPVLVAKDTGSKAEFLKTGVEFDEMMFSKWMTFLTSIVCAVYGMAPDEINFESFSSGKSSLSGSDTAEKLASSKDIGLLPLMSFYEAMFSDFIIAEFDPKFCFRWVGLKEEDEEKAWEAKKLILSVDELRAEQGYGPWQGDDVGKLPVNPALISAVQAAQQAAQQAQQPQEPGSEFGGPAGAEQGEQPDYGNPDATDEEDGGAEAPAPGQDGQNGGAGAGGGAAPAPGYGGAEQGDFGKALRALSAYAGLS